VHLTGRSGRTGIENNWYALTGRVVAVKVEADGDLHIALQDATGDKPGRWQSNSRGRWPKADVKRVPNGSEPRLRRRFRQKLRRSDAGSVLLEIGEGAFGFACARFLKASDQRLIEYPLSFGLLPGLELGHAQIKQGIGVERFFPSAFL
jgi:hypothetical protein